MKSIVAIALAMSCLATARAADDAASAPAGATPPEAAASVSANQAARLAKMKPELAGFCLYGGAPGGDAKYTALAPVKTSRETYGSVLDELPRFVETSKAAGADAVIKYNGAQHFGFWPWRLVRPLLTGVPIKWDGPAPDCVASGGQTFATVMNSNKEPPKR